MQVPPFLLNLYSQHSFLRFNHVRTRRILKSVQIERPVRLYPRSVHRAQRQHRCDRQRRLRLFFVSRAAATIFRKAGTQLLYVILFNISFIFFFIRLRSTICTSCTTLQTFFVHSAPMRHSPAKHGTCPTSTPTRCSFSTTCSTSSSSTKPSFGATSFSHGKRRILCTLYVAFFCAFLNCFARFARFAHHLANHTAFALPLTYRHGTCGNLIAQSVRKQCFFEHLKNTISRRLTLIVHYHYPLPPAFSQPTSSRTKVCLVW